MIVVSDTSSRKPVIFHKDEATLVHTGFTRRWGVRIHNPDTQTRDIWPRDYGNTAIAHRL